MSFDLHPSPASRLVPQRAALALFALSLLGSLLGCAQPGEQPLVPERLRFASDRAPATTESAASAALQTRITPLPVAPGIAPAAAQQPGAGLPPAPAGSGAPVSVNLEQVTIGAFAQVVFGDLLKRSINVDEQVLARKDLITFRSGGAQPPAQIDAAAKLLLKSYGLSVIDLGAVVRVLPDNANLGNLPEIRRGAALPDTPLPLRPVFQLVELQAVQVAEVAGWLRTMFGERVRLQEDIGRNAVLLSGNPDSVQAALEAIRVLDQPVLRGVQSVAISPLYWSADDLARRLVEVLSAQGYAVQPLGQPAGGIRFPIVILPVAGINAVYVFARQGAVLDHITEWARTLDKPNDRGIGKNFFTYSVKHKDAAVLAATLEQLLSRSRGAVATGTGAAAGTASTAVAGGAQRSGAVVVDASTNMLIFQSSQDEYSQMIALLQTLDRPARGALIEVTVAELSMDDSTQLGVEWLANQVNLGDGNTGTVSTQGGLALGTAGLNFRIFNSANALKLTLNALASQNRASVLSSPRVLARNGESATIQVGQEVPIITSQQSTGVATSSTATSVLQTIQYRNTGVILKVKPVIHSSDQIDLDVSQEVSAAQSTSTGVNNSPTFSTRKIDTKLTMRNGATVLLGGLISDDASMGNSGVPLFKDIPVLGALFRNQTTSKARRELVILITPYVINDDHEAESVTNAFRKMLGPWAGTVPSTVAPPSAPSVPSAPAAPAAPLVPAADAMGVAPAAPAVPAVPAPSR